ncbi:DMT family transporter [Herbaspirillum sp. GCM10030257]|uniref:DMT family transporter n=1 Tax=Herbaspirillum sp. GCM10030257 TaxID=3273393 RepID=UPI00360795FB
MITPPQPLSRTSVIGLTLTAMIAFAANSLLCRMALKYTAIDPASFTTVRILSGALVLWLIVTLRGGNRRIVGNWLSAMAIFVYAAAFSFAYVSLSTATGALILFGAVQASMIGYGLFRGERLRGMRRAGFLIAACGLLALLLPGASRPSLGGSLLMLASGAAWAVYSLRAKGVGDPTATTAGNFMRALPLALGLSMFMLPSLSIDLAGLTYAAISGGTASGLGYVIWYMALRGLSAIEASTVQLFVPVLAAGGGTLFLSEPVTLRLLLTGAAILGGVAMVVIHGKNAD